MGLYVLLTVGCSGAPAPEPDAEVPGVRVQPLEGAALYRRISLDLRGALPTDAELDRAEAGEVDPLVDELFADPRLEARLTDLLGERWLTRVDRFPLDGDVFGYQGEEDAAFRDAIGEEPVRLAARIVADDRPWSEVVTGDTTMVEETLAAIWPVAYPEGASGWQEVRWTDGRPALGVLGTNGFWWRYDTSQGNLNRHRASALAQFLLCEDYLSRPVAVAALDPALAESVEELVHVSPGCLGCHASLDPLASALFGFWWLDGTSEQELVVYHPEREHLGAYYLDAEPAWYGTPVEPAELGAAVAADDRFGRCAVQTWAELLWRRPVDPDDFTVIAALEADLGEVGFTGHALLRAVLETEAYRAGALGPGATAADAERTRTRRMMSDLLYASVLADLTGFQWRESGIAVLQDDEAGYRVLAGGVDGRTVTRPLFEPGLTRAATLERLAEAAASHAVTEGQAGRGRLVDAAVLATRPGDDAFRAALSGLRRRATGALPEAAVLDDDAAMWTAIEAVDGADAAWTATLAVIFRDPAFGVY